MVLKVAISFEGKDTAFHRTRKKGIMWFFYCCISYVLAIVFFLLLFNFVLINFLNIRVTYFNKISS
jgi:hypothetical protein